MIRAVVRLATTVVAPPLGGGCVGYLFCGQVLGVLSGLAVVLLRKGEQPGCFVLLIVLWLPVFSVSSSSVGLRSVIVALPGHTRLLL